MNEKQSKKVLRKEAKAIIKREIPKDLTRSTRRQERENRNKRAIRVLNREGKSGALTKGNSSMFRRIFTDRDAARLAWMLTVTDPFGKHNWSIPPVIGLGVPLSAPRMYRVTLKGFAQSNANGRCYIGLNADMWLPNSSATALTVAEPRYGFLGNSTANGGSRGAPLHYTNSAYVGCAGATPPITGSDWRSYPSSVVTQCTGLTFMTLPDNFINTQLNNNPASANAYQRAQCVSAGLRVRPVAPAAGALVPQGVLLMTQQTLGDTVQTNATAASSPSAIGGVDVYSYMAGLALPAGVNPLTPEMVAIKEVDMLEWPMKDKGHEWLSAAAIPNQSCALAAWVPPQVGTVQVGQPQLACIGSGMLSGQTIEFEGTLVYAFYGGVSYEVNPRKAAEPVPYADLQATASSAVNHMAIDSPKQSQPSRQAVQSVAQTVVDAGDVSRTSAADWIKSGSTAIEAATGSSIGDLIGEGLGFLASALL